MHETFAAVSKTINQYTTGATSGGFAYLSGAPELTLVFVGFVLLQF